uniref:GTD-binding domain-containing protein n=1 Tax=Oryza punctata TaxID=4537 RepID=A0A0E0LT31_ORYPU
MAGVGEDDGEVAALREALRQQAAAVEELRGELEEERQAAASGADEALAMIVRLQAEKAAERMEAEQFRRVAEERIQHDEASLAFLKAVVFHQEMEISSLNRRLIAAGDVRAAAAAVDLPWLRKLAKNGVVPSRRNASLPAARLEDLCSEIDAGEEVRHPRRPTRTVSDIGEVIGREKEWLTSNASHRQQPPPPRLHRSASHRLRRVPSYSETATLRSSRRASPEIISEEDDDDLISRHGEKARNACNCNDHTTIADIEQIKLNVQNLQTEFTKTKEATISIGDLQARLLTEICAKLDAMQMHQDVQVGKRSSSSSSSDPVQVRVSREEGSSSKGGGYTQSELLMNQFIEAMMYIPKGTVDVIIYTTLKESSGGGEWWICHHPLTDIWDHEVGEFATTYSYHEVPFRSH